MATVVLTRVRPRGVAAAAAPSVVITFVRPLGYAVPVITRTITDGWVVRDTPTGQTLRTEMDSAETVNRSEAVSWSMTGTTPGPIGGTGTGGVSWVGIAGGASHTGAAAVGYVLWGGAGVGTRP